MQRKNPKTLKTLKTSETSDHLALVKWAKYNPRLKCLIHIANEYDGGRIGGYRRKLMGVKAGVSDFFLPLPLSGYHGMWIELKAKEGGRVSREQKNWLDLMQELGYFVSVCYGFDDAVSTIRSYLSLGDTRK